MVVGGTSKGRINKVDSAVLDNVYELMFNFNDYKVSGVKEWTETFEVI